MCRLRAGTRAVALLAPLAARHRAALALVPLLAAVLGLPRAATGAAPAPREDLLTLANGAIELYGIHFDFDSAALQPRSEPVLRQLADALGAGAPFTAAVIGHTDAVGDDAYNLDLSRRRAESVAAWLADHGVERARLDPDGRGEREPVADDATADGRALNRRVTVVKRPNP